MVKSWNLESGKPEFKRQFHNNDMHGLGSITFQFI